MLIRELNRTICTLIMCICNMNFIVRSLFLLRDTTTMLRININKLHAEKDKLHTNIIVLHVDMNSPVHIFYLACRWRKHVTIPIGFFWKGGGGLENTERHLPITTCIRLLDTNAKHD